MHHDAPAKFRSLLGWYLNVTFLITFGGYLLGFVLLFSLNDHLGRGFVALVALFLIVGAIHMISVFMSTGQSPPRGPHPLERNWSEIDPEPEQMVRLKELVDAIATDLRLPPPDDIRFDGLTAAHVFEDDYRRRVLVIGGVLMASLPVTAFAGVIAHELAHFKQGDTDRYSDLEKKQLHRLGLLGHLAFEEPGHWINPGFWLVGTCCRKLLQRYGEESQDAEFAADRYSAEQSGPEIAAAALIFIHIINQLPWSNLMTVVEKIIKTGSPDHDVFAEQVRMIRGTHPSDWTDAVKKELKRKTKPYDSHPCLRSRLKALGVNYRDALTLLLDPASPRASSLVDHWDQLAERLGKKMTSRYRVYYYEMKEFKELITGYRDNL